MAAASVLVSSLQFCDVSCPNDDHGTRNALVLAGAAAAYLAGIVYDIADAPAAADRYNKEFSLKVAPGLIKTPNGTVPTLGLAGRF